MRRRRVQNSSTVLGSQADVAHGLKVLRSQCRVMRKIGRTVGEPALRRHAPGFEGLARIVVGQQLSIASAAAIWGRVTQAVSPVEASQILALDDEALRACGLSRPKMKTIRAIANAEANGTLDLNALTHQDVDDVRARLIELNGVGPWTADIYIMFCVGHRDGFAGGDLALQEAACIGFGLDERPKARQLVALAERWRPWRGVAALVLWDYYKHMKDTRSGAPA